MPGKNVRICCYPGDLLQSIPLRIVKTDPLSDVVGCHQTPVDLQVDGHQQQTLGKQIHLWRR